MDLKKIFSIKRMFFLALFIALVYIGNKINFSAVVGANNQFFTLFQFFGPIAGSFLGPLFGALSVLLAQGIDFLVVGKAFTWINLVRLTPMVFAAWYFGSKKRWSIVVPIIAMVAFIAHPIGRQVWFFSLFWTIPVIIALLPKKYSGSLALKSIGATFTAHSVGGAAWIWAIPMTSGQWIALIPVVIVERLLFAGGIAASYVVLNTVLDKAVEKLKLKVPSGILCLEKKYVLSR